MAAGPQEPRRVVVVAAVVERADRILVTERLAGTHLAGHWEFPGGKMEEGEDHRQCLEREMREELEVGVEVGDELHATSFDYPDRTVELHFYRCAIIGEPKPVLGQRMRWVSRAELKSLRLPPADLELIRLLARRSLARRRSATAGTDAG
ncbi:MAG: NUDIX domain-containing protein [Acidobacteria bacterium]|nr:MAG: NUDIX domain-containing protein [Acidobacteriota bacterium]